MYADAASRTPWLDMAGFLEAVSHLCSGNHFLILDFLWENFLLMHRGARPACMILMD